VRHHFGNGSGVRLAHRAFLALSIR
jgi:hypothetical protein